MQGFFVFLTFKYKSVYYRQILRVDYISLELGHSNQKLVFVTTFQTNFKHLNSFKYDTKIYFFHVAICNYDGFCAT